MACKYVFWFWFTLFKVSKCSKALNEIILKVPSIFTVVVQSEGPKPMSVPLDKGPFIKQELGVSLLKLNSNPMGLAVLESPLINFSIVESLSSKPCELPVLKLSNFNFEPVFSYSKSLPMRLLFWTQVPKISTNWRILVSGSSFIPQQTAFIIFWLKCDERSKPSKRLC